MSTYTRHFVPLKITTYRTVVCPGCDKRRRIQRTFRQTVNPYHRAVRALPATASYQDGWNAVWESVRAEAKAWQPSDYESRHDKCAKDGVS